MEQMVMKRGTVDFSNEGVRVAVVAVFGLLLLCGLLLTAT